MPTARHFRLILLVASLLGLVFVFVPGTSPRAGDGEGLDGRAERLAPTNRPTVEAAFPRESYAPGNVARLVFWTKGAHVSFQVFRAGTEDSNVRARDVMLGTAVTSLRRLGSVAPGRAIQVRIGEWPSGLYFAKLVASGSKVGYAPFVLRPRVLGEHHVAVVLSTMTWQAYNFHDDDGNGTLDTWYAGQRHARLGRPYENRGVIPHYKHYEQPFLRWLIATGRNVDYLADADLDASSTTARRLADVYDLIVFPGHHEYVTEHEFVVVTGFRNRGGNLMFLSANNFFWRIVKRGNVMTRTDRWRRLGRPEAALIGVQYFGNDAGQHPRPGFCGLLPPVPGSSRARVWDPARSLPLGVSRPMKELRARRAEHRCSRRSRTFLETGTTLRCRTTSCRTAPRFSPRGRSPLPRPSGCLTSNASSRTCGHTWPRTR
jgi:hypothetical protein